MMTSHSEVDSVERFWFSRYSACCLSLLMERVSRRWHVRQLNCV